MMDAMRFIDEFISSMIHDLVINAVDQIANILF